MAIRGTLTAISGRTVFFRADGAPADSKPEEFRISGDGAPKVLRHAGDKGGKPEYVVAYPSDLRNGMAVRLMGPPKAELHTVVILSDPKVEAKPSRKPARHGPAPVQPLS